MEHLIERFRKRIDRTDTRFVRSIMDDINWGARLIGIKGARGVGKTTLLLQYIKLKLMTDPNDVLYVSLDNIWFSENKLIDLAEQFAKRGGKYLFLDEVHKYPGWAVEIKNIYDDFPELQVVFTGSSLIEILNARADLSRRAIVYSMQGLSFREFLNLKLDQRIDLVSFKDVIENHEEISRKIVSQVKPLKYFNEYLSSGYYPYFIEQPDLYHIRLEAVINMIIEIELTQLRKLSTAYVNKIKQLLLIISESAPFIPNISKISQRIGINRETLLSYIHYLKEAELIVTAYKDTAGISRLQKPDKIFLENTNLMYALSGDSLNIGNARETFFINQLKYKHDVQLAEDVDFLVDQKYSFEVGGKGKKMGKLKKLENAFVVSDDIEYGFANRIPLWLFGFLY